MVNEFEGKTEKEAIEKAMLALGLDEGNFEVEILSEEERKFGFFKKHTVRIRVHHGENSPKATHSVGIANNAKEQMLSVDQINEIQEQAKQFLQRIVSLMGHDDAPVSVDFVDDEIMNFNIDSQQSALLIGKQGRNLNALQLIVKIYVSGLVAQLGEMYVCPRVVVDSQNYRGRREEVLRRDALRYAEIVVSTKKSRLLDPMNAAERRLIHTTLSNRDDLITQSEGSGDTRQVRIIYKGSR